MNQDEGTTVIPGAIEDTYPGTAHGHGAYDGHDGHDGPHECEFCSPEPELIPAPWEREPGAGASGEQDAMSAVAPAEPITELWT